MFYAIDFGRVHQTYQMPRMLDMTVWIFGKKNALRILYLLSLNLWSWPKWVVCHMRSNSSDFCLAVHLCWRQWVSFLLCMIWIVNWKWWLNWWNFEELLLKQKFISSAEIKHFEFWLCCHAFFYAFFSFSLLLIYFLITISIQWCTLSQFLSIYMKTCTSHVYVRCTCTCQRSLSTIFVSVVDW